MRAVQRELARAPEHEFEAARGLPEALPAGERLLWQGQPSAALVARHVFHLRWIAGYFAAMLGWRAATLVHDGATWAEALRSSLGLGLLAAIGLGLLGLLAWLTATTTVYTLTDQRVVLRVGIVLTVTYNLPLRCIDAAHLRPLDGKRGEIALALRSGTRIAFLHLWPHARAWHLRYPQPMLRCLEDAAPVAQQLAAAWSTANAVPAVAAMPQRAESQPMRPALTPVGSAG